MNTFEKNYIGKGTQVENLDIVTVCINIDDAQQHIFEYEGKNYLRFELARMKETSKYGKTHTCYVSQKVPQEQSPAKGRKKK